MIRRLRRDGWPPAYLFVRTLSSRFPQHMAVSNTRDAQRIHRWVRRLRERTGHRRVDIVAHSLGNLAVRYFLNARGGASMVRNYVSLGGMHRGLSEACSAPYQAQRLREMCPREAFLRTLGAAQSPTAPVRRISVAGAEDETVPVRSTLLSRAAFVLVPEVTHAGPNGLLEHPSAYRVVRDALRCRIGRRALAPRTARRR